MAIGCDPIGSFAICATSIPPPLPAPTTSSANRTVRPTKYIVAPSLAYPPWFSAVPMPEDPVNVMTLWEPGHLERPMPPRRPIFPTHGKNTYDLPNALATEFVPPDKYRTPFSEPVRKRPQLVKEALGYIDPLFAAAVEISQIDKYQVPFSEPPRKRPYRIYHGTDPTDFFDALFPTDVLSATVRPWDAPFTQPVYPKKRLHFLIYSALELDTSQRVEALTLTWWNDFWRVPPGLPKRAHLQPPRPLEMEAGLVLEAIPVDKFHTPFHLPHQFRPKRVLQEPSEQRRDDPNLVFETTFEAAWGNRFQPQMPRPRPRPVFFPCENYFTGNFALVRVMVLETKMLAGGFMTLGGTL